jgi:hypothetical protein
MDYVKGHVVTRITGTQVDFGYTSAYFKIYECDFTWSCAAWLRKMIAFVGNHAKKPEIESWLEERDSSLRAAVDTAGENELLEYVESTKPGLHEIKTDQGLPIDLPGRIDLLADFEVQIQIPSPLTYAENDILVASGCGQELLALEPVVVNDETHGK